MPGLNTWQQLTLPSLAFFINGVSHTKKVSTNTGTLEGLLVCGAAHGNKDGGRTNAAHTRPVLFILLSKFRIYIYVYVH